MDSKTYNKDVRKACVKAVFDEFAEHGDMIRPQYASLSLRRAWIEISPCNHPTTSRSGRFPYGERGLKYRP